MTVFSGEKGVLRHILQEGVFQRNRKTLFVRKSIYIPEQSVLSTNVTEYLNCWNTSEYKVLV